MKRKLKMALASLLAAACLTGAAGAASFDSSADRLSDLGLFQGTDEGYELDRAPTRAEARRQASCWSACWAQRTKR